MTSKWGISENNRKAKFYTLTKTGRKQLAREAEDWLRIVDGMGRLLADEGTVVALIQHSANGSRRRGPIPPPRSAVCDDEVSFHLEIDRGLHPARGSIRSKQEGRPGAPSEESRR